MRSLMTLARWLLVATSLVPLVIDTSVFFPFAFPKLALFRLLVELAFTCVAFAAAVALSRRQPLTALGLPSRAEVWGAVKSPLGIAVGVYLLSFIVSTLFATDTYRAFWGDVERGGGLIGILHVALFGVLLLALFRDREWLRYVRAMVVVGFITCLYAAFQYFGITWVPFARPPVERVDSFIGNAAFLATHAIFVMTFAWILAMWEGAAASVRQASGDGIWASLRRHGWRWCSYLAITLAALSVLFSGTRGAMLGLLVGFVVAAAMLLRRGALAGRGRTALLVFSGVVVLLGGVFWATRTAPLWQSVPGFNRLALTEQESLSDASTEVRLMTWRIAGKSFLDKPIFGWGPEHYITAYERRYDPAFAYYGETWLDRAHNNLFDIGVTQGVLGIISYLAVWAALMALVWRSVNGVPRAVLIGFFTAYFVQNLVLFDQVVSYLAFTALVAWIARRRVATTEGSVPAFRAGKAFAVIMAALGMAGFVVAYHTNILPYAQAKAYKQSPALGDIAKVVEALKRGMYPYTYAQWNIRGTGVDAIYQDQYFYYDPYRTNPKFKAVGDTILAGAEEVITRHPEYDVRAYIRYATLLQAMARDDGSYYGKAAEVLERALTLAPSRQELYYLLAFSQAGENKLTESVETARKAVALDERVARAHFHLALMLDAAGKQDEAKAEVRKVERLDPSFHSLLDADFKTLAMLYSVWSEADQLYQLINRSFHGQIGPLLEETYTWALKFFADRADTEKFTAIAGYIKSVFPKHSDDMDVLMDLAKRGQWDIIRKL